VLQVIVLYVLCKNIGRIVAAKGRPKFPFQLMVVLFWFGGEFAGGMLGMITLTILSDGKGDIPTLMLYPFALVAAGLGVFIAFRIAKSLSPVAAFGDPGDDYDRRWQEMSNDQRPPRPLNSESTGVVRDPKPIDERFSE
jgi:hypothetical protein